MGEIDLLGLCQRFVFTENLFHQPLDLIGVVNDSEVVRHPLDFSSVHCSLLARIASAHIAASPFV
jgi:hypothetical protein